MCPKCKSKKTEIYNSRKNGKHRGSVWRRRNCLKCFHSWTTIEVSQKHYDELSRQARYAFHSLAILSWFGRAAS